MRREGKEEEYRMGEATLSHGMFGVRLFVKDSSGARKLLVEARLVNFAVVDCADHRRVVEGEVVGAAADHRT